MLMLPCSLFMRDIKIRSNLLVYTCLTLILLYSSFSCAGEAKKSESKNLNNKMEWTLGAGLGVFEYHLYPGAKETRRLIFPVPHFTFRSEKFEIDRGLKSFLYHSKKVVVDISMDFGLPVNSEDTQARKGMPDLDFMLQVGPSIEFLLNDKNKSYFDTRFEIPVRVAFASDFRNVENIGYLIEPRFSFNHRRYVKTGVSQKMTVGLKFATEDFHAYYYDVADAFSTAARESFTSQAGFGGSFAKYRISYRTRDFIYWAFVRYQSLHGAKFEESPLVLKKDYYFIGLGASWIFAGSF